MDDPMPEDSAAPPGAAAAAAPADGLTQAQDRRERRDDRSREVIEVIAAVVLGLATVLTAWSAYQAVVQSGASLEAFTESSLTSVDSTEQTGSGDILWTEDLMVFLDWEKAVRDGDAAYADHLTGLMSQRLIDGIAWWRAQPEPRPASPFVEGSPVWTNYFYEQGEALAAEARASFERARAASATSDQFTLSTVLYSIVLFFAGLAAVIRPIRLAAAALTFSIGILVVATLHLAVTQAAI
jgi:hypothetical protein